MDRREAVAMSRRYLEAIKYLENCGEMTLEKYKRAWEISGARNERILQDWLAADDVMARPGEPGGKEYLRFTMIQNLTEGIKLAGAVAGRAAPGGCALVLAAVVLLTGLMALAIGR